MSQTAHTTRIRGEALGLGRRSEGAALVLRSEGVFKPRASAASASARSSCRFKVLRATAKCPQRPASAARARSPRREQPAQKLYHALSRSQEQAAGVYFA